MFGLFSGLFRRRRSNLFGGGRSKKKKQVSVTKKRKAKGISQKIVSDSAAGKRKANVLNDGNANGQVVTLDGKPLESFKIPWYVLESYSIVMSPQKFSEMCLHTINFSEVIRLARLT